MELKQDYRLTIGYTYYNEPELLSKQLEYWESYPGQIQIIVVDDGSEIFPASDLFKNFENHQPDKDIQLWRVTKDLGFNSHGCRNLIATIASCENILFMDIDCFMGPENVAFLKKVYFNPNKMYYFNLYNSQSRKYTVWPGHHNIFIVNKEKYWQAGGYDESFTGYHKGDREFLRRLYKIVSAEKISPSMGITLARGGRKVVITDDVDKTTYDNKNMIMFLPEDEPREGNIIGTITTKLNFPYERIL